MNKWKIDQNKYDSVTYACESDYSKISSKLENFYFSEDFANFELFWVIVWRHATSYELVFKAMEFQAKTKRFSLQILIHR